MSDEVTTIRAACAADIAKERVRLLAEIDAARQAFKHAIAGGGEFDIKPFIERQFVAELQLSIVAEEVTDEYRFLYGTNVFPKDAP